MKNEFYFIEESAPSGFSEKVVKAFIVIRGSLSNLDEVFPEGLSQQNLLKELRDPQQLVVLRQQNSGNLAPENFSLADMLGVKPNDFEIEHLLVWKEGKPSEEDEQKLRVLWREPAIEQIRVLSLREYLESGRKPSELIPRDTSWDEVWNPEELGLEFREDEKLVLIEAAKAQGRAWRRAEWELFAQTWSEHCKHKIFSARVHDAQNFAELTSGLFSQFIKKSTQRISENLPKTLGPWSCFHDNAGVIPLRNPEGEPQEFGLAVKMETHNSPTAISPYGGASTGVLGVHRDILGTGLGAKPLATWNVLCLEEPKSRDVRPAGALDADVIRKGVLRGIQDAGNQSGIPTVCGSVVFDKSFAVKPYVFAGCVGLIQKDHTEKRCRPLQSIYCLGGATGADGIRGAVFSSRDLRAEDFQGSVVQVANPFVQRKLTEFLLEALRLELIEGITDNGAGGLACSVGEIAQTTGGAEIDIANLRLKNFQLESWEKLLSESQERMTVITAKNSEFEALANRFGVGFDFLGILNQSGRFIVRVGSQELVNVPLQLLHESCPKIEWKLEWNASREQKQLEIETNLKTNVSLPARLDENRIYQFLSSVHVASREKIVRRFDHEVQGRTMLRPFEGETQEAPQESSVLEVRECGAFFTIAHGLAPQRKNIQANVLFSFEEALRKAVLLGAFEEGMGALDNFSWPDPLEKSEVGERRFWRLIEATRLLCHLCEKFRIPLVSGKDSMKNNSKEFAALETLVVSMVGSVNPKWVRPAHFQRANDVVYVWPAIAGTLEDSALERALGYLKPLKRFDYSTDLVAQMKLRYSDLRRLQQTQWLRSIRGVGEGGVFLACFEASLGNRLEVEFIDGYEELDLKNFEEGLGGFLMSCDPKLAKNLEESFPELRRLGVVRQVQSPSLWEKRRQAYVSLGEGGFWQ